MTLGVSRKLEFNQDKGITNLKKLFVCCSCCDVFIQLMEGYFVLKKKGITNLKFCSKPP